MSGQLATMGSHADVKPPVACVNLATSPTRVWVLPTNSLAMPKQKQTGHRAAEGRGFEPRGPFGRTGFRDRLLAVRSSLRRDGRSNVGNVQASTFCGSPSRVQSAVTYEDGATEDVSRKATTISAATPNRPTHHGSASGSSGTYTGVSSQMGVRSASTAG